MDPVSTGVDAATVSRGPHDDISPVGRPVATHLSGTGKKYDLHVIDGVLLLEIGL